MRPTGETEWGRVPRRSAPSPGPLHGQQVPAQVGLCRGTHRPEKVSKKELDEAAARLKDYPGLRCKKLQLNSSGCHGCKFNPLKGQEPINYEQIEQHEYRLTLCRKLKTLARIMQEIRIRVDWGPEKMP